MGLDIWFSEDIRNALLAADEASGRTAIYCPDGPALQAYRAGYRAALVTVALAFGISPAVIICPSVEAGALVPISGRQNA